jgi:hypothetical protein
LGVEDHILVVIILGAELAGEGVVARCRRQRAVIVGIVLIAGRFLRPCLIPVVAEARRQAQAPVEEADLVLDEEAERRAVGGRHVGLVRMQEVAIVEGREGARTAIVLAFGEG